MGWTLKGKVPVGITMGHHKKTIVFDFWLIICNEKWMFQYFWIVCLIIWKAEPISLMLTKHFWQVIYTHLSSLTLPNGAIYFPGVCRKWLAKMCAFCTLQRWVCPMDRSSPPWATSLKSSTNQFSSWSSVRYLLF